jgi:selenide, water dikinase
MSELTQVLRHLIPYQDANVLVDASTGDDAAVYRIGENRALVTTVDFFTPIVDDPFDFGRIAAANALSDIYAMGARPLFALNLVAFPRDLLGSGLLEEIVRGGSEMALQAGAAILGGHSIDDNEPKYGLVAVGEVALDRLVRNAGAQPGDVLILTKPLGTGVIATAIKAGVATQDQIARATASMIELNRAAAEAMLRAGVNAATDVTGFGLLGHLRSMLRASGVSARVYARRAPLLPGAYELAEAGRLPGGTHRNRADLEASVTWDDAVPETMRMLLCDAQTSGGLLISTPRERADQLLNELARVGTAAAARIGEVTSGDPGTIQVQRG